MYDYDWAYAYFDVCCDFTCPIISGVPNSSTITTNICVNGPFNIMLCTSKPSHINYQWFNTSGPLLAASCLNVSTIGNYTLTSNPPGNPTYTLCEIFNISPPPVISFSLPNTACSNSSSSVPLFASPVGGTFSGLGVTSSGFGPWLVANGTHTITYSFTDSVTGCYATSSQTISVITCTVTGIESAIKSTELIVAPNPFQSQIFIHLNDPPQGSEFILFNTIGQEILRKRLADGKNTIETEGIPQGLYLYSIERQNKPIKKGKLVKD